MVTVGSILSYIFLFLVLVVFVFLSIAVINIFSKSYKPINVLPFLAVIVILFLVNTVIGFSSIKNAADSLSKRVENSLKGTPKSQETQPATNNKKVF
jgi:c-di-AMP phosphodiesterase-like protein